MKSRRSSASLTLVLISAATLQGCGKDLEKRDVYRNTADCKRDWGDENKCERVTSGPHSGFFYGPSYGSGHSGTQTGTTLAPRAGSSAMASTHTTRGGFGSSASAHGASS